MSKKLICLALLAGWLAFNASASVVVTKFDPPLAVSASAEGPDSLPFNVISVDFNLDGESDFVLGYGQGEINCYFNATNQVFIKIAADPGGYTNVLGPIAAVPLGSTIASNVISSLEASNYCWFAGITNNDDLTQSYGNHEDLGMIVVDDGIVGDPPIASGDMVGKEGAMVVQFYINGLPHFGYIHFDFRPQHGGYPAGTAGYIYGWAYETQPNTPIVANSIGTLPIDDCEIVNFIPRIETNDTFLITWNAVAGGTYHVESSTNLATWTDISGDIIANLDYMNFTTPAPPAPLPQCFFRVHRVN